MKTTGGSHAIIVLAFLVSGCGDDLAMDPDGGEADAFISQDVSFDVAREDVTSSDGGPFDAPSFDTSFDVDRIDAPTDAAVPDSGCEATDLCDGADNDCDGNVDEDAPMMPCGTNEGVCMAGVRRCVAGAYAACEGRVTPSEELCDGLDNDCNGSVDNGVAPRSCGTNVGACRTGTRRCAGGSFAACTGQTGPSPEVDDLIDNDCDGTADEGFPCMSGRAQQNFVALNTMRRGMGLAAMRCNRRLRYAAQKHAQWLCDSGATMPTHVGRGGSTDQERIAAEGVTFTGWAENVAVGFSSAQAVHNAWMASADHRPPMVTPNLTRVGIGYVNCGGGHWWVQNFAN